jgi:hypothetical protein
MDKQTILKKLKAFSERTVENGCTEAEAIAAAQAMQGLQEKYNLTLTELDITQTEYVEETFSLGKKRRHPVWCALYGLQKFCEVRIIGHGGGVLIFGERHKVDAATYLISVMQSAMELEFLRYKSSPDYAEESFYHHARTIRSSFMNSMAYRLSKRLLSMHEESRSKVDQPAASNGTALVVMADNALAEAHAKKHPHLRSSSGRQSRAAGAGKAGAAAANRVGLRTGVSGGGSSRRLIA